MKRRTVWTLIGILVITCLVVGFSAVYPITPSEPHAATIPSDRFTVSNADEYSVTGRIVIDRNRKLAFEGVVTAEGAWYQKVKEPNLTSEKYHPSSTETVYERLRTTKRDRAGRIREQITEDTDRKLVRENRDGDRFAFVVTQNTTEHSEPVSGTASVFIRSLSVAGYETHGADASSATVYKPQSGWYGESEPYRISKASGTLRADPDTHAVKSANVSWAVTEPAGTYAEYVLLRLTSEHPTAHEITFEFNSNNTRLERPNWVGDIDSN